VPHTGLLRLRRAIATFGVSLPSDCVYSRLASRLGPGVKAARKDSANLSLSPRPAERFYLAGGFSFSAWQAIRSGAIDTGAAHRNPAGQPWVAGVPP
jgi:hypothetical protein